MAFAVPTFNTAALDTQSSVVLTKPTGTAEGNLLFVHIGLNSGGTINSVPSGFTLVNSTGPGARSDIYVKVATSSEPADYTFGFSASVSRMAAISRVTGNSVGAIVASSGEFIEDAANPSFNIDVTPTTADSGIFFFVYSVNQANAIGGYAIATDNPTWTEAYEHNSTHDMALAYATRTAVTTTGDASLSGLDGSDDGTIGTLVVVNPASAALVSPADCIVSPFVINQPVLPIAIPSPLVLASSLVEPTTTETAFKWANTSKNAATFTNTSKNAASSTNTSKSSSTWSNTSKS